MTVNGIKKSKSPDNFINNLDNVWYSDRSN